MQSGRTATQGKWALLVIPAIMLLGCGIFGKDEGPKERTLELTFEPSGKLNFDGTSANVVEIAVFALSGTDRFLACQVQTLFDPNYDHLNFEAFAQDTLASWKFTIKPGERQILPVRYTPDPGRAKRVHLGVVGDFFRPPGEGRERKIFPLTDKAVEKLIITLGENTVESIRRTE
jgi:type VI secretion system VasD/TssJ family lipoprotein